jgi:hypothetical protein
MKPSWRDRIWEPRRSHYPEKSIGDWLFLCMAYISGLVWWRPSSSLACPISKRNSNPQRQQTQCVRPVIAGPTRRQHPSCTYILNVSTTFPNWWQLFSFSFQLGRPQNAPAERLILTRGSQAMTTNALVIHYRQYCEHRAVYPSSWSVLMPERSIARSRPRRTFQSSLGAWID